MRSKYVRCQILLINEIKIKSKNYNHLLWTKNASSYNSQRNVVQLVDGHDDGDEDAGLVVVADGAAEDAVGAVASAGEDADVAVGADAVVVAVAADCPPDRTPVEELKTPTGRPC